jgi:hypothetical protein
VVELDGAQLRFAYLGENLGMKAELKFKEKLRRWFCRITPLPKKSSN